SQLLPHCSSQNYRQSQRPSKDILQPLLLFQPSPIINLFFVKILQRDTQSIMRPQVVDGLIIGAGPAGLAAGLAFARTHGTAIIFDSSSYRNEGIKHMHTVPSRDHSDPYDFRRISREQIESRYHTVWFENTTITHAAKKLIGK